jgi:hypothetical protein
LNHYIKSENENCLFIYNKLLEAFEECDKECDKYINLISIFFHDLMRILTGYFLKLNAINKSSYPPKEYEINFKVTQFPYISYMDVINGIDYESKNYTKNYIRISKQKSFFELISGFKNNNTKKVCFGDSTFKSKLRFLTIINKGYRLKYIQNIQLQIPNLDIQLKILNYKIIEIFSHLGQEIDAKKMINLIKLHIMPYIGRTKKVDYDLLMVGSMTELNSRLHAAIARSNNIPVVSVSHGEGDQLMFDEPRFGYSERTYPSILFGYGPFGENISGAKYINCLFGLPRYWPSNSDLISGIYNDEEVKSLSETKNVNWMYVPDSLQYVNRYGPWANIPDGIYYAWQKELIKSFPNIIYKRHPKGHLIYRQQTNNYIKNYLDPENKKNIKIIAENFSKVFNNCDAFIFDHISTAFMIACATNKPIVYFDIGKRNLISKAKQLVKKRCIYLEIDPQKPGNIMEKVESKINMSHINQLTKAYSINANQINYSRDLSLMKLLDSVLD